MAWQEDVVHAAEPDHKTAVLRKCVGSGVSDPLSSRRVRLAEMLSGECH
jgi:hypothetical protein